MRLLRSCSSPCAVRWQKAREIATTCCTGTRKAERAYRLALAELFQGTGYINMFKRREIYRHLSNTADRIATCADMLHDITVKMG